MVRYFLGAAVCVVLSAGMAFAGTSPAPKNSKIYILWPKNGQVIQGGKFWLRMGNRGAGIAPAGIKRKNTGHHHLVVDAPLPPFDDEIPADKKNLHFGGGQTEVRIELPPGKHTLQLLFGDHEHVPHNPPLSSKRITVIVPK